MNKFDKHKPTRTNAMNIWMLYVGFGFEYVLKHILLFWMITKWMWLGAHTEKKEKIDLLCLVSGTKARHRLAGNGQSSLKVDRHLDWPVAWFDSITGKESGDDHDAHCWLSRTERSAECREVNRSQFRFVASDGTSPIDAGQRVTVNELIDSIKSRFN